MVQHSAAYSYSFALPVVCRKINFVGCGNIPIQKFILEIKILSVCTVQSKHCDFSLLFPDVTHFEVMEYFLQHGDNTLKDFSSDKSQTYDWIQYSTSRLKTSKSETWRIISCRTYRYS